MATLDHELIPIIGWIILIVGLIASVLTAVFLTENRRQRIAVMLWGPLATFVFATMWPMALAFIVMATLFCVFCHYAIPRD